MNVMVLDNTIIIVVIDDDDDVVIESSSSSSSTTSSSSSSSLSSSVSYYCLLTPGESKGGEESNGKLPHDAVCQEQSEPYFRFPDAWTKHGAHFSWGFCGTGDKEPALRPAEIHLSRHRVPPPAPWIEGVSKSLRSLCC
ncbi:hypothetical protein PoB_005319300 [Plakobranchus ocellatus]|uniref:Uncharacterized protein n=1 Tax=Plakobranchus ocellatus TaxID=259542 RepID=A0AAV4C5J0_9GAST|nr:hypothetical protein PoB_005319300 [Plakobranchus ocellatus]